MKCESPDLNQETARHGWDLFIGSVPTFFGVFWSVLFCCFQVMADSIQPSFPVEVTMNKDAGRGNFLLVTLHLRNGAGMPFIVDTGMPTTCFDESLKPKLGKRLATEIYYIPGSKQKSGVYASPKLYLGDSLLMTDSNINTLDFKRLSAEAGCPIKGILGIDCLKHYCVQLDFEVGKMRFLDIKRANVAKLGKAFPLIFTTDGPIVQHTGFLGETNLGVGIDTGCVIDGLLKQDIFREFQKRRKEVDVSECIWDGETYTNLYFGRVSHVSENLIGLRFLARHLVTLDFPNGKIYLNRTCVGPLSNDR